MAKLEEEAPVLPSDCRGMREGAEEGFRVRTIMEMLEVSTVAPTLEDTDEVKELDSRMVVTKAAYDEDELAEVEDEIVVTHV